MSLMKSNSYVLLEVFLFRRVTAKQKYVPKIEMNSRTVVDLEKIKILRRLVTVSMKESAEKNTITPYRILKIITKMLNSTKNW